MLQSLIWYNYRDSLRCGEFSPAEGTSKNEQFNKKSLVVWNMNGFYDFPLGISSSQLTNSLHHFSEALKPPDHHPVDCVERPYVPYINWVWFHLAKWRKKSAQNLPIPSEVIVNRHDFWQFRNGPMFKFAPSYR